MIVYHTLTKFGAEQIKKLPTPKATYEYPHRDVSFSAFQVFDWESFAATVRHHCLEAKNFDSSIETSILSSASIYFSFVKDGEDDVDTPCWVELEVLPAMEQGKGNVTQGDDQLKLCHERKG